MPITEEQPHSRAALRVLYWVISLSLAGLLLYYSLRDTNWSSVWNALRQAEPVSISIVLLTTSAAVFLRSIRWRILLLTEAEVTVPTVFWATSAGYLGNNVLPARAGELVRTVMISRRSGLSKAFVLTTALSERVADAIALVTISAMILLTLPVRPGWLAGAAKPFAAIGLIGAAGIALLPFFESFYFRVLARLPVPQAIRGKVENGLKQAIQGIRTFHNGGRLTQFLGLTTIIWCMDATTAVLCAKALGLSMGIPVAFLFIAGLGLGSALPSTPGYVGIYQFVAVSVLTPFGFTRSNAIAFVLLLQGITYALFLVLGGIGLAKERKTEVARASA